jgi:hypothetical protein
MYTSNLKTDYSAWLTDIEDQALLKEYVQMGLLPETNTPLTTILTDFYSSFPAAFYEIGTDSIYLIPNDDHSDADIDIIIAHELTHALQDQNFTMRPTIFPDYSKYNSDAEFARRSVWEGDARFTEAVYAYSTYVQSDAPYESALENARQSKDKILQGTFNADPPVFLDVRSSLPYFLGPLYIAGKYHLSGSWEPVNQLYSISTLPHSVAEINSGTTVPVTYFDFHELHSLLVSAAGTIEFVDDDNAGCSLLLGCFYQKSGMTNAECIAHLFNWRGDRYTFVKRTGQPYGTLVWTMAFADDNDAHYLFNQFTQLITSRRLNNITATVDSLPDSLGVYSSYTFTSSVMSTTLKLVGNEIWWLDNAGELTEQILALLRKRHTPPPTLAKSAAANFPASLPAEAKWAVTRDLLRYTILNSAAGGRR